MDSNQVIGKALTFIENNLHEPITASDVADAVSYSYYHFHRYFQSVMGETIGSYIRGRRMNQAARELVHSNKKILDIAVSLYFESAESFTRAFKSRYGLPPNEYRKNGVDVLISNHQPANLLDYNFNKYFALAPEIITIPAKYVMGKSFNMSINDNISVSMWENFNEQLIKLNNDTQIQSRFRYGIFEANNDCVPDTFSAESQVHEFIGIEVWDGYEVSFNMQLKEINGGKYAKFIHTGKVDSLIYTYQYIWGVWFPKSGYKLANRVDFECYTERFLGADNENSQVDIYFPIE